MAVSYMIWTKLVITAGFSLNKFHASNNFEQKRAGTKIKLQEMNCLLLQNENCLLLQKIYRII